MRDSQPLYTAHSHTKQVLISILLIVPCLVAAQDRAPAARNYPVDRSRIYEWNAPGRHDLSRWLKDSKPLLNRGDVCTVRYSYSDEENKVHTSNFALESLLIVPEDEEVKRIVREKESGLDVRIGVQYHALAFGSASEIRIALAFDGASEDIFDEIGRSEAITLRDTKWKLLETTKSIRTGGRLYRFSLTCENGKTAFIWLKQRK